MVKKNTNFKQNLKTIYEMIMKVNNNHFLPQSKEIREQEIFQNIMTQIQIFAISKENKQQEYEVS